MASQSSWLLSIPILPAALVVHPHPTPMPRSPHLQLPQLAPLGGCAGHPLRSPEKARSGAVSSSGWQVVQQQLLRPGAMRQGDRRTTNSGGKMRWKLVEIRWTHFGFVWIFGEAYRLVPSFLEEKMRWKKMSVKTAGFSLPAVFFVQEPHPMLETCVMRGSFKG